ncbi:MAG: hypothetical protein FJZ57_08020 [Chlamydiae bacterium]|nr:hypothetical protein [Chlamydiota bacterium]
MIPAINYLTKNFPEYAVPLIKTGLKALSANSAKIAEAGMQAITSGETSSTLLTPIAERTIEAISSDSNIGIGVGAALFASTAMLFTAFNRNQQQYKTQNPVPETEQQPVVIPRHSPVPIEVRDLQHDQDKKSFTSAVKKFLSSINSSKGFSLDAYKKFITSISAKFSRLSRDDMHGIATQEFNKLYPPQKIEQTITELNNQTSIQQEAQSKKESLLQAKQEYLAKESELAGTHRFNGKIDKAWQEYFNARKEFLQELSPLCRFIKNKTPQLSEHEGRVLRSLKPSSQNGSKELKKMEKGLIQMATGGADLPLSEVITRARNLEGSEERVAKLLAAFEKMNNKFDEYQQLDEERIEIAGVNINPTSQSTTVEGTIIADLEKQSVSVDVYYESIKKQRTDKLAFIQMISSLDTLKAAFQA